MWGVKAPSARWDWDGLRSNIKQHGVRNSLLVAPMPTASTSQVRELPLAVLKLMRMHGHMGCELR